MFGIYDEVEAIEFEKAFTDILCTVLVVWSMVLLMICKLYKIKFDFNCYVSFIYVKFVYH